MNAPASQVRLIERDDGIVELAFAHDVVITRALAEEGSRLVREARQAGAPGNILVDVRHVAGADADARKVAPANQDGRVAVVLDSFFIQTLMNLFMERNRDAVKRRVFRNRELAIEWLLEE